MAPRHETSGPALFSQGFRPFFLVAGIWAVLAMMAWWGLLVRGTPLPTAFGPTVWHAHAFLFGFLGAALAGFLTTAIPNWTGRMPISGVPLGVLAGLWLLGRVACAVSQEIGASTAMVLDLSFFLTLTAAIAREIAAGRNWRNLPVVGGVLLVTMANVLVHLAPVAQIDPGYGLRLGMGVFASMIALIGGRIVPSFTRNWLSKRGAEWMPAPYGSGDRLILIGTVVAMLAWVVGPAHMATGIIIAFAAVAHLWRLSRWCGASTWREPLLLVLHIGYGWLVIAFAMLAAAILSPAISQTAAVHALTAGAFSTMVFAVMTRAALGHTGHALTADLATSALFVLLTVAAVLRVAASFAGAHYLELLAVSALAWIGAGVLFVLRYAPILLRARR